MKRAKKLKNFENLEKSGNFDTYYRFEKCQIVSKNKLMTLNVVVGAKWTLWNSQKCFWTI